MKASGLLAILFYFEVAYVNFYDLSIVSIDNCFLKRTWEVFVKQYALHAPCRYSVFPTMPVVGLLVLF